MQAADVLSAMSLMSADAVAAPGVMMFIGASLLPGTYNLTRHHKFSLHAAIRAEIATEAAGGPTARCGLVANRAASAAGLTEHDRCGCKRGYAFAPAGETEALGSGGLDGDARLIDLQD